MRRFFIILWLLLATPCWAAFASVGTLGTGSSTTSSNSVSATLSAQCDAGNLCLCTVAKDNISTSDGNTTEVASFTDSAGGNTWAIAREFTYAEGAAGAGATVAVGWTKATNSISSAGTITANFGSAVTSKALSCWEFSLGAGNTVQLVTASDLVTDSNDAGSIALSGLASKEYLFFRGEAGENEGVGYTPTANYTAITQAIAATGNNNTAMTAEGEFRILTGTGDTTDPDTINNRDWASTMLALEEVAEGGGGPSCPRTLATMGVGC